MENVSVSVTFSSDRHMERAQLLPPDTESYNPFLRRELEHNPIPNFELHRLSLQIGVALFVNPEQLEFSA
ncbi:hypothetical protein Tco_0037640 [Tanacetum coccineum]